MIIVDDVLNPIMYRHVHARITDPDLSWFLQTDISGVDENSGGWGWCFTFVHKEHGITDQRLFEAFLPILGNAAHETGKDVDTIYHARSFLTFPLVKKIKPEDFKHKDMEEPHQVCLYYVSDHTGDDAANTVFFNEDGTVAEKVEAKANRAVIFDGSQLHAGAWPSDGQRYIINFNFSERRNDA